MCLMPSKEARSSPPPRMSSVSFGRTCRQGQEHLPERSGSGMKARAKLLGKPRSERPAAPFTVSRRTGRNVLLLARKKWDAGPLPDLFPGELLKVTVTRTPGAAIRLVSTGAFDAIVLHEPPCEGASRSELMELLGMAERLHLPACLSAPDMPLLFSMPEEGSSVLEDRSPDGSGSQSAPIDARRLMAVFEKAIRPAFRGSGGDVELVRISEGGVVIRFVGVCAACPASRSGHLEEIDGLLRAVVPGVRFVELERRSSRAQQDHRDPRRVREVAGGQV